MSIEKTFSANIDGTSYQLDIIRDDSPTSPREDGENFGTMVTAHRRYTLGDVQLNGGSFEDHLSSKGLTKDEIVQIPIYMYDHSGLALSTSPFSCQFDSGQLGVIYVSIADIKKEYGSADDTAIERARSALTSEVKTYGDYLAGEVYGYRLTTKPSTGPESEDECWGFYGADPAENGMFEYVSPELAKAFIQSQNPARKVAP